MRQMLLLTMVLTMSVTADEPGACQWRADWPVEVPVLKVDEFVGQAIEEQWPASPNFACSAVLVTMGCGTGCVTGGIYDHATQRWHAFDFAVHRGLRQTRPLLSFSVDSVVLTAFGYLNEQTEGEFRYHWNGYQLRGPLRPGEEPNE